MLRSASTGDDVHRWCECGVTDKKHHMAAHVGVFRVTRELLMDWHRLDGLEPWDSAKDVRRVLMVPDHVQVTIWVERDRDTVAVRLMGDPLLPYCPDGEYIAELDLSHPFLSCWREGVTPTLVLANGA